MIEPSRKEGGPRAAAEEIYAEYCRRASAGEDVSLEDYCQRHPSVAHALRLLHAVAEEGTEPECVDGIAALVDTCLNRDLPDGEPAEPAAGIRPAPGGKEPGPRASLRSTGNAGESPEAGTGNGGDRGAIGMPRRRLRLLAILSGAAVLLAAPFVAWSVQAIRVDDLRVELERARDAERGAMLQLAAQARAAHELEGLADLACLEALTERAVSARIRALADERMLERWLEEARELHGRLPRHRAVLEELRNRGRPVDFAAIADFPEIYPLRRRLLDLQKERAGIEEETELLGEPGDRQGVDRPGEEPPPGALAIAGRLASLRSRKFAALRLESRIEAEIRRHGHRHFESPEDQRIHDAFARLVAGIVAFAAKEPEPGPLAYLEALRAHGDACLAASGDAWREAVDAIADPVRFSRYGGRRVSVQTGLLPLGPDPRTGLWEFAHVASGKVPPRGPDGGLVLGEDVCIVLVLLPGDPPLLASKHEMTQEQWLRLAGTSPSFYGPEVEIEGRRHTLRHPLEGVSAREAATVLERFGLRLPPPSEWARAARGGTTDPWPTGSAPESLAGHANLRDKTCGRLGGVGTPGCEAWLDDGYLLHAPVGSFAPNPYGIHDIAGNVSEWCASSRSAARRDGGGESRRDAGLAESAPVRGGSFADLAEAARVDEGREFAAGGRAGNIGVRPFRSLEP